MGRDMRLKSLRIHRGWTDTDPLRGEIEFFGPNGEEFKSKLDEQLSEDIVRVCAEAIVRAAHITAEALSADALRVTAIEHKQS